MLGPGGFFCDAGMKEEGVDPSSASAFALCGGTASLERCPKIHRSPLLGVGTRMKGRRFSSTLVLVYAKTLRQGGPRCRATRNIKGSVLAGLGYLATSVIAPASAQSVPNFAPTASIGWYAYNRQFIAPPSGPGPVMQDPGGHTFRTTSSASAANSRPSSWPTSTIQSFSPGRETSSANATSLCSLGSRQSAACELLASRRSGIHP
jgi:hypothetical protein